jgi:thiamine-monophosphate kinase
MTDDLATVGERAALARIIPRLARAEALLGPGDDAALLAAPDGRVLLSTDAMVQGPDFRRAWSTPFELGWKAAVTNLIDVAAMGGRPTGLLVALAAPGETPVEDLEGIADGLAAACAELAPGVGVVGGDLTRSPVLALSITVTGSLDGRAPVLRSGARPGDVLAYSGRLGLAAAGLRLLFATGEEDADAIAALRHRHGPLLAEQLAPRPPIADGVRAAEGGATAMLDVSDGLALDARRIAEASGVRIDLDAAALAPGDLDGGEAHALLATFGRSTPIPATFRVLGRVLDGSGLTVGGEPYAGRGGWDPFVDGAASSPRTATGGTGAADSENTAVSP